MVLTQGNNWLICSNKFPKYVFSYLEWSDFLSYCREISSPVCVTMIEIPKTVETSSKLTRPKDTGIQQTVFSQSEAISKRIVL